MAIFETKTSRDNVDNVCRKLKFSNWIRVEAIGFSGGIWFFWNEGLDIQVIYTHPQFVVTKIKENNKTWNAIFVDASPDQQVREKLWRDLRGGLLNLQDAWVAVGDFNAVTKSNEVSNPTTFNQRRCKGINEWMFEENLVDLGYTGPIFTWMRGKDSDTFKGARLDRALSTIEWINMFPKVTVKHLPFIKSDHALILVRLDNKQEEKVRSFKFQAAWMTHPEFNDKIKEIWKDSESAYNNVKRIASVLKEWNSRCFGNIHKRNNRILARLNGIQRALSTNYNNGLIKLDRKLRKELDEVLYQEELLWYQQSRENWIFSGDRNTWFYKARANKFSIKGPSRELIMDNDEMKEVVRNYFKNVFTEEKYDREVGIVKGAFHTLNNKVWEEVNKDFSHKDIKDAMFDMAPFKAPRLDGFHAGFYQNNGVQ